MTDSLVLMTAQISTIDSQLVLIHIPIELYSIFVQPILRLLFGEDHDEDAASIPWTNRHEFFNLSIIDLECSIICSKRLAQKYIIPHQELLQSVFNTKGVANGDATVHQEEYTALRVEGQGLDAGQRVLELTGPLAMAGISIFFITTYFCDYVLVPAKSYRTVTVTLEQRGFVFSQDENAYISQLSPSLCRFQPREKESFFDYKTSNNRHSHPQIPSTPPAQSIDELQARTFKKLKTNGIRPSTNKSLRLVSCAGGRERDNTRDERLKNDLLQVLLSPPKGSHQNCGQFAGLSLEEDNDEAAIDLSASFISLTITADEPISILLEEHLLSRLGQSLYGAKNADDILAPITFDLRHLAFETSGIIGGVAGRLSQGKARQGSCGSEGNMSPTQVPVDKSDAATEINFLSTTKAGTVIVKASQLDKATKVLNAALEEVPYQDW